MSDSSTPHRVQPGSTTRSRAEAALPVDEAARLKALEECRILDTPPEQEFDDLTELAAEICGTPVALISLVDENRQWFKSRVGFEAVETPRHLAFCARTILDPARMLIVPDATKDLRFAENELVTGETGIRFYAGAPLVVEGGHALGSLCVIDRSPRELTPAQCRSLAALARQVVSQIQLRRQNVALRQAVLEREAFFDRPLDMLCIAGADGFFKRLNPAFSQTLGFSNEQLMSRSFYDFVHPDDVEATAAGVARVVSGSPVVSFEHRFLCQDGSYRWLDWKCAPAPDGVLYASARDVTEQKRMVETLHWREAEMRVFFDYLPALIAFKDLENRIVRVNQRLADSIGKPVAEIEGRKTEEMFPRDAAKYFADDLEVIRSGVPKLGIIESFRGPDGLDVWIQTDKVPARGPSGAIIGVVAMAQDISERRLSEASLEKLARRLQLATKASGTGVWEWDVETGDLVWDEQMYALYGLPHGPTTYGTWASLLHPDDLEEQSEILRNTVATRGRSERKFRIRRASDGALRILYSAEMAEPATAGATVRIVGVNRDITELETAVANLAANDELLRRLIQHAPAAIAMLDRDMRYLQVSERWMTDYHLPGRDIIGRSHYEIFPDVPERWRAIHRRCLAGAVESCAEDPFPRADGALEWLQWEIRPWLQAGGEIGGVIIFTQVITERKRAEALLVESERRFREAVKYSAMGMALVGLDGRWLEVNGALCDIVGYREEELRQLTFQKITHPDDQLISRLGLERLLAGEMRHFKVDKRYLHKDGRIIWVTIYVTLLRDAAGEPSQCITQIEDITSRHEAEEQLKASLEEKETLLQEVHHRVKNNLQVISSLLALQSRYIRDPELLIQFEESQGRIRSMALIHEKLYQSDSLAHVDLRDYLTSLSRMVFGSSATSGNVRLDLALAPVSSDIDTAVPLGLLVNELLTNALKHAFPARRAGRIAIGLEPAPGGGFVLSLEDNGVGLPAEFDPERSESLGTRLVGLFVKQLQAEMQTESDANGTRFCIFYSPDPGAIHPLS